MKLENTIKTVQEMIESTNTTEEFMERYNELLTNGSSDDQVEHIHNLTILGIRFIGIKYNCDNYLAFGEVPSAVQLLFATFAPSLLNGMQVFQPKPENNGGIH